MKEIPKVVKAKNSEPFKIYKKNYSKGKIQIPLEYATGVFALKFITFIMVNPNGAKELSCGGQRINVALSTGELYRGCKASSTFPGG